MIGRLYELVFDCPDPRALAIFYEQLLGLRRLHDDPGWVTLGTDGDAPKMAFQRIDDYRPPRWPDPGHPGQLHADVMVPDLDVAEAGVLALGATLLEGSDKPIGYRVYADPAGHPFCLITPESVPAGLVLCGASASAAHGNAGQRSSVPGSGHTRWRESAIWATRLPSISALARWLVTAVGRDTMLRPPRPGRDPAGRATLLAGGAGEVGRDDVGGVPVQAPLARSYLIVVRGSACEAVSCTSRNGTPASKRAANR